MCELRGRGFRGAVIRMRCTVNEDGKRSQPRLGITGRQREKKKKKKEKKGGSWKEGKMEEQRLH